MVTKKTLMMMAILMLTAPYRGSSIHTNLISQSVELEGSKAKCHHGIGWLLPSIQNVCNQA
jgi:hypothetical protein